MAIKWLLFALLTTWDGQTWPSLVLGMLHDGSEASATYNISPALPKWQLHNSYRQKNCWECFHCLACARFVLQATSVAHERI
jgi:hypothetical protein